MMSTVAALEPRPLVERLRAVADETRLRILAILAHGELCVCHVEQALGLSQPTASRHLAVLRTAGLVERRRCGAWIYYRLADADEPVLAAVLAAVGGGRALRGELARLRRSCGPEVRS